MPPRITKPVPVKWSEGRRTIVADWLDDEIRHALDDRREREKRVEEWQKTYEALPDTATKDFPWPRAANFVVPIAHTTTDAIFARLVNTLFSLKPFWSVRALSKRYADMAKPAEQYLEWAQRAELRMYDFSVTTLMETVKLGEAFAKVPWQYEWTTVREYNALGHPVKVKRDLVNHPLPTAIPWQHLLVPSDAIDLQTSRWVGHQMTKSASDLRRGEMEGKYRDIEAVLGKSRKTPEPVQQSRGQLEGVTPRVPEAGVYDLWEVHATVDVDGDGMEEDVVLLFHPESKTILRAVYNPYFHGRRPFVHFKLIPREHRFNGIGVCELLFNPQAILSTIHNQRVDNATIANMRCFWAKKGNSAIRPGSQIYPGKMFFVDDKDGFGSIPIGDIYQSTVQAELLIRDYCEKLTGVSDYSLGSPSGARQRAPATTALAMLQEGNRRFDFMTLNIRQAMGEVGMQSFQLYQQYAPDGRVYEVLDPSEGELVEQVFRFPKEHIRGRLGIDVTASSSMINREVDRQMSMTLFGMVGQLYERLLGLVNIVTNPKVPPPVRAYAEELAKGLERLGRRAVQAFDVRDPDMLIPEMEAILQGGQFSPLAEGGRGGTVGGAGPGGLPDLAGVGARQGPPSEPLEGTNGEFGGRPEF